MSTRYVWEKYYVSYAQTCTSTTATTITANNVKITGCTACTQCPTINSSGKFAASGSTYTVSSVNQAIDAALYPYLIYNSGANYAWAGWASHTELSHYDWEKLYSSGKGVYLGDNNTTVTFSTYSISTSQGSQCGYAASTSSGKYPTNGVQ